MSRFKAAAYHFLISVAVVAAIITLMLFLWYPNAYFKLMGGKTLIYLIAGVDVFLGPLLTLVVFKTSKKSLKFDLACIGLVQLAAMSYGLYVMFESRPVFTVFTKNAFYVASVVDIVPSELAMGKRAEWRTLSITGPRLVAIGIPVKKNKEEFTFFKIIGAEAVRYPKLYADYKNHQTDVLKTGKPLAALAEISAENKASVDAFLQNKNRLITDFLSLPIYSAVNEMSAIVDAKTGDFIQIIDAKQQVEKTESVIN